MALSPDTFVRRIPSQDPRLGRHVVHDPQSRGFAIPRTVDRSTWRTKLIRLYDPLPNPEQIRGNCTGCDSAMGFNATGNRRTGVVFDMDTADAIYSLATTLDPWPGAYPPDDTGSSGISAAKAAQRLGYGGTYRWHFGGADDVVQTIHTGGADGKGRTVGVGTSWTFGMFEPFTRRGWPAYNGIPWIEPTGGNAGGHQYRARGYVEPLDAIVVRCWWGAGFRDVLIKREHLGDLLADDGDAYEQDRA